MNTQAHRCFLVIVFSLIGISIVFLSFVFVTSAQSRTWYIKADGTGDAPTIQAGVDSASIGDTVLVAPGTYCDSNQMIVDDQSVSNTVHICKNVILIAESGPDVTTIDGSQCDIAVYISGADSTAEISGFTINTTFSGYGCVDLTSSSKQSVYAGEIQPFGDIAVMCQNSTPRILGNRLFDNRTSILLEEASPTIVGNEIFRSMHGIFIQDTSSPVIEGNILCDCAVLIIAQNSSPVICNNQLFSQSGDVCVGITLDSSSGLISGNRIRSTYNYGIYMAASSTIITGNRFENNSNAVFDVGGPSVIQNNLITGNGLAVEFFINAGSQLKGNTIVDFTTGVYCESSSPQIQNNILCRGQVGIACFLSSTTSIGCNDIYDVVQLYVGDCPDQTGLNGNFSGDPEFCGIDGSGNYYLQSDSPCAPGNHPDACECGLIGALPVNCKDSPVEEKTWGHIKTLYSK